MHRNIRVDDLAAEVLARQARARAEETGEPFKAALRIVLETEAGRQLDNLRYGPHRWKSAQRWQENLLRGRAEERVRARRERLARATEGALLAASW